MEVASTLKLTQEVIIVDKLHHGCPISALHTQTTEQLSCPCRLLVQLKLDLDMLVAVRTAPGQRYINPVERIMSILNAALYGVSLERTKMDDRYESVLNRCSSMSEIREKPKVHKGLEETWGWGGGGFREKRKLVFCSRPQTRHTVCNFFFRVGLLIE